MVLNRLKGVRQFRETSHPILDPTYLRSIIELFPETDAGDLFKLCMQKLFENWKIINGPKGKNDHELPNDFDSIADAIRAMRRKFPTDSRFIIDEMAQFVIPSLFALTKRNPESNDLQLPPLTYFERKEAYVHVILSGLFRRMYRLRRNANSSLLLSNLHDLCQSEGFKPPGSVRFADNYYVSKLTQRKNLP